MTVITVHAPRGLIEREEREILSRMLTDAVLVPEIGQDHEGARLGFQVWFRAYQADEVAIGGKLIADAASAPNVLLLDVAVMDGHWPAELRQEVITRCLAALSDALGRPAARSPWWVNFRIIDEGSWGSRGGVTSILKILESGVFTPTREMAIRNHVEGQIGE